MWENWEIGLLDFHPTYCLPYHLLSCLTLRREEGLLSRTWRETSSPITIYTVIAVRKKHKPALFLTLEAKFANLQTFTMAMRDAFDVITEPRRSPSKSLVMRLARTRRTRTVVLASILLVLLVVVGWRGAVRVSCFPSFSRHMPELIS